MFRSYINQCGWRPRVYYFYYDNNVKKKKNNAKKFLALYVSLTFGFILKLKPI